jgi:hypothetical protein
VLTLPRTSIVATTQGTLALDIEPRREPPSRHRRPSAAVLPLPLAGQREVEAWARRFTQAAVEIVGGDRLPSQLVRWTSREVYQDLCRRALLVARAGGHQPGQRRVQPVRPQVQSVHASLVAADVAETSIRVAYGERSRAIAARFERSDGRWVCTALDFA